MLKYAMSHSDIIKERNKASDHLICSCENNIVNRDFTNIMNRDFTNIMNLFHVFVWLNKAMKLLIKNHEIHPIWSIPKSECSNTYYEFISCPYMAEQSTELLIKNHETCPIGSASFPEVNAATFDLYDHDIDYGHGYKGNFKNTFCHQKWHNNVKKGKENCENIGK